MVVSGGLIVTERNTKTSLTSSPKGGVAINRYVIKNISKVPLPVQRLLSVSKSGMISLCPCSEFPDVLLAMSPIFDSACHRAVPTGNTLTSAKLLSIVLNCGVGTFSITSTLGIPEPGGRGKPESGPLRRITVTPTSNACSLT